MKLKTFIIASAIGGLLLSTSCVSSQKTVAYNETSEHLDEDGDVHWDDYAN